MLSFTEDLQEFGEPPRSTSDDSAEKLPGAHPAAQPLGLSVHLGREAHSKPGRISAVSVAKTHYLHLLPSAGCCWKRSKIELEPRPRREEICTQNTRVECEDLEVQFVEKSGI